MEILDSLEKLDGIISSSSPSDNNNINPVIPQNVIESESTATKQYKIRLVAGLAAGDIPKGLMKEE